MEKLGKIPEPITLARENSESNNDTKVYLTYAIFIFI